MGKKSVVDSSFMESAFEDVNVPTQVRAVSPLHRVEDLLVQMLSTPRQKQALTMLVYIILVVVFIVVIVMILLLLLL